MNLMFFLLYLYVDRAGPESTPPLLSYLSTLNGRVEIVGGTHVT
jgi:hypothetical protein